MSIHPSLRGADNLVGERSVFSRRERIERLIRDGKMTEEDSAYGLPKVRTRFKVKGKKKKEDKPEAAEAPEGEAAEEASE